MVAPVGIIRGYAAHPVGVAVALLWRCLALGARLELGVRTYSPDDANKKPQLMVWGLVLLVKCGAPVGIDLRGYAAKPRCGSPSLCFSAKMPAHLVELGVRTYSPDDANKKPQLKSWGLIFGAPGGIRTPDQVVRSHLLYPAELRVLEVVLSVT